MRTMRSLKMRVKYDSDYDAFRSDPYLKESFTTTASN